MELDFPQGDLEYSMTDKVKYQFLNKMKQVVWAIEVKRGKEEVTKHATGFCIDASGLLLTAARIFKVETKENEDVEPISIYARREGKDGEFHKCEIGLLWKHFNLALLRVSGASSNGFNYVSIDGAISRNIDIGLELFTIGIWKGQYFNLLRGTMTYEHQDNDTDYFSLAEETEFDARRKMEETSIYVDRPHRVIKGSFHTDPEMHPELKYLSLQFMEMTDLGALAGAPLFNSKGKLLGIIQSRRGTVNGVTSSALEAIVKCYKESLA